MFRKIRNKNRVVFFFQVSLLVLLLLILSSGQDLFHNHEPDFKDHQDCPAFQIYLLFSSTIVSYCVFCFILSFCTVLLLVHCNSVYSLFKFTYDPRAPPFQIIQKSNRILKRNEALYYQNLKGTSHVYEL